MRTLILIVLCGLFCLQGFAQPSTAPDKRNSQSSTATNSTSKAKNNYEKALAQPGASMPALTWLSADEKIYADSNLRRHTPVILVLFNPSCGHCMEVAVTMKMRIQELFGVDIVFLTGGNLLAELPSFIQQTRLSGLPNVFVGTDYTDISKQLFEYNGIPQIMVYNKDHILLKTYYKQIDLDEIIRLVRTE